MKMKPPSNKFIRSVSALSSKFYSISAKASSSSFWALQNLDIDLYDNQIEVVDAVCDLSVNDVAVLMSRGGGKSFAVAVALIKLCLDLPGFKVGVFGPKADQANRILKEEITGKIIHPKSKCYALVDWERTTGSRVRFINGSEIVALSASETSQQEGWHFHCVVLDECHRISDLVANQRIRPMLGSFSIAKTVKIGISMYRQNFWKSCCGPRTRFKVISKDWTECPILLKKGSVLYKGKEYPTYVLEIMPLSLKQQLFPDRPDLHYDGDFTELDFNTQYAMVWETDLNLVLNEQDQTKLVSGTHDILEKGRTELSESYFFGLDTAGGTVLQGKKDLDFTVLSIWRKNLDNSKEKVFCYEWQGDVPRQMDEILSIIHPETGVFKCKFGLADYSNIAISIVELFKQAKIPIEGIAFGAQEPTTHKNYKNAMVDQFVFELQANRVMFPSLDKINKYAVFKKSLNEWFAVERYRKQGINDKISAPMDAHDDHVMADILAVWAADRFSTYEVGKSTQTVIPTPLSGGANIQSRFFQSPEKNNRYLR